MSFAQKYNKGNIIFDIDITDFNFIKLEDIYSLYGKNVIKVDGLYINKKGNYNPHPVGINIEEKMLIDLPQHMTTTINVERCIRYAISKSDMKEHTNCQFIIEASIQCRKKVRKPKNHVCTL